MIRYCWICLTIVLLSIPAGCEKSPEPRPRASVAKAGLMPDDTPAFEPLYVANQSSVKLAPVRTVSYDEPLDTFREQNAARAEALRAKNKARALTSGVKDATDAGDSPGGSDDSEYINADQIDSMKQKDAKTAGDGDDDESLDDDDGSDDESLDDDDDGGSDDEDEDLDDDDDSDDESLDDDDDSDNEEDE